MNDLATNSHAAPPAKKPNKPRKPTPVDPVIRIPYEIVENKIPWEINVVGDGTYDVNGFKNTKWYFNHPNEWKIDPDGKRSRVVISRKSQVVIEELLRAALRDKLTGPVKLGRTEFDKLEDGRKRLERMDQELAGSGLSAESLVGQCVPGLRRLPPHVSLATVIDKGLAHYVPLKPKTVQQVYDELHPNLRRNSKKGNPQWVDLHCRQLISVHGADYIHMVGPEKLEALSARIDQGEFVTAHKKQKLIAKRQSKITDRTAQPEILAIYDEGTRVHRCEVWHHLFLFAFDRGALPKEEPIATEVMEWPDAPAATGEVISLDNWRILLPILDLDERRFVALYISDARNAEINRSLAIHIVPPGNGVPKGLAIPPNAHTKETNGRFAPFIPTSAALLATCRPTGEWVLPELAANMMVRIFKKAAAHGIKLTHNCLRRIHESYVDPLIRQRQEFRSHTERVGRKRYRVPKSLEECAAFCKELTADVPPYLLQWVVGWVDDRLRAIEGGPVPENFIPPPPVAPTLSAHSSQSSISSSQPSSTNTTPTPAVSVPPIIAPGDQKTMVASAGVAIAPSDQEALADGEEVSSRCQVPGSLKRGNGLGANLAGTHEAPPPTAITASSPPEAALLPESPQTSSAVSPPTSRSGASCPPDVSLSTANTAPRAAEPGPAAALPTGQGTVLQSRRFDPATQANREPEIVAQTEKSTRPHVDRVDETPSQSDHVPAQPGATLEVPRPPDVTPASPADPMPLPELPRHRGNKVDWEHMPEELRTYLFTNFKMRSISRGLGISFAAVSKQRIKWEKSRNIGPAKADGAGDLASAPVETNASDAQIPLQNVVALPVPALPATGLESINISALSPSPLPAGEEADKTHLAETGDKPLSPI